MQKDCVKLAVSVTVSTRYSMQKDCVKLAVSVTVPPGILCKRIV